MKLSYSKLDRSNHDHEQGKASHGHCIGPNKLITLHTTVGINCIIQ